MTDTRPTWTVLISTGNPQITHTEIVHSLYALRQMIDYYGEERLMIFGEGFEQ